MAWVERRTIFSRWAITARRLAHRFGRDPDAFQHTDRVELGQGQSRFFIGLDLDPGDQGDVGWVNGDDRMDVAER